MIHHVSVRRSTWVIPVARMYRSSFALYFGKCSFANEPLTIKPVTCVPGVGRRHGSLCEKQGYDDTDEESGRYPPSLSSLIEVSSWHINFSPDTWWALTMKNLRALSSVNWALRPNQLPWHAMDWKKWDATWSDCSGSSFDDRDHRTSTLNEHLFLPVFH